MVMAEFFYAEYGLVASTDLGWLQLEFDTLMGLFDRLGMRANIYKTVGMMCRLFQAAGVQADEAYTWQMTGGGLSFKERMQ